MRLALWTWTIAAGCCVCAAAVPAVAGNAQLFPVRPHLVPAAVVAAFMLPAAAASVASILRRARRSPLGVVGLIVAGALAALAYVNPGVLDALRI